MEKEFSLRINGKDYKYPENTTYRQIAADFQKDYENDIALVISNGRLKELFHCPDRDCELKFVTTRETSGHKAYKRSATMLLLAAFYEIVGEEQTDLLKVEFSIGAGYYIACRSGFEITDDLITKVKDRMHEMVREDMPIIKTSHNLDDMMERFHDRKKTDKEKLFRYRRSSSINMYSLNGFEDYYYGYMLPSAGYIRYFDLFRYQKGMILQMPERKAPRVVPELKDHEKLFATMIRTNDWGEMIGLGSVGDLNDRISSGGMQEVILVQEALHESRISEIAKAVKERGDSRFIMIAGPSSSGKTTFSHRLSVELTAHGLKPHPIALDNYFRNREDTPLDEDGNYDFECLEAIDVEGFNRDMTRLLNGEKVEIPSFNFKVGKREYKGDFLQLAADEVLVIEGIHGLNDKLSYSLPPSSKFKVYISALTTLNVDDHNRIPTTDGRLLRRIVRDYRTRGASASRTLNMWASVRRGEEKYIFPFQESADAMFNSHLFYELAVLKPFVEPLLFGIEKDDPAYFEAKRLLKFLDYFLSIDTADIPHNSIVREFIGGSCFNV